MFREFDINEKNIDIKKEELKKKLEDTKQKIQKLKKQKIKSYENFSKPLQKLLYEIELDFTPISHLNYVCNSKKTEEVYNHLLPILTEFHTLLSQDEELYKITKMIAKEDDLNEEQKRVLELDIKDFELSGVGLSKEKKQRLTQINLELSQLQTKFAQNLLKATDSFEMEVDFKDIKEFPKSDIENAKKGDKYIITLKQPSYIAFMTYSTNRKKREELYKAYSTRAPQNEELITKILSLRDEEAKLLGFSNFAEVSLSKKMASSPDEVLEFLYSLAKPSLPKAKEELKELEEFASKSLEPWDIAYYSEKLKKKKYDIDDEVYMPYFEKEATVKGMFNFLEELFGIEFEKTDAKVWHKSVEVYDLKENGRIFGRIYCDLETREGKRGGAWMDDWEQHPQSAFIVANFSPSSKNTPSLLRPSDVETLFHEMGHAIHHLFSKVSEINVNGIGGVEWDGVEFPSQFLENFAYEPKVLQRFAKHYETKEVLPTHLIQKLKDAKNYHSAMMVVRQLEFSIFDMKIHLKKYDARKVQEILDNIRKELAVVIPPNYNKFQNSFSHIFAGGYSAGYYSYKWAEVLSADAFFAFVDNGIFNKRLANKYKKEVLEVGGSRSIKKSFEAFLKKEPDTNSLLRLCEIV
jgi:oligopeptidase A